MYLKRGGGARSTPQVGLPSPLRNTVWCTCCARPHAGQDKRPGLQKRRAGAQPLRRSPRTQRPATRTASRLLPLPPPLLRPAGPGRTGSAHAPGRAPPTRRPSAPRRRTWPFRRPPQLRGPQARGPPSCQSRAG